MKTRIASAVDFDGILALQELNLLANLSAEQQQNGFVTTAFTIQQLEYLCENRGLFVLEEDNEIQGYTMAEGWDYFSQWPIFPYMLQRLTGQQYQSLNIDHLNTFQYGPVCIAEHLRGSNAFSHLFESMRIELNLRYPVGITFINKQNQRSFHAHIRRLAMQVIDEFSFNQQQYFTLAFATNKSVLW